MDSCGRRSFKEGDASFGATSTARPQEPHAISPGPIKPSQILAQDEAGTIREAGGRNALDLKRKALAQERKRVSAWEAWWHQEDKKKQAIMKAKLDEARRNIELVKQQEKAERARREKQEQELKDKKQARKDRRAVRKLATLASLEIDPDSAGTISPQEEEEEGHGGDDNTLMPKDVIPATELRIEVALEDDELLRQQQPPHLSLRPVPNFDPRNQMEAPQTETPHPQSHSLVPQSHETTRPTTAHTSDTSNLDIALDSMIHGLERVGEWQFCSTPPAEVSPEDPAATSPEKEDSTFPTLGNQATLRNIPSTTDQALAPPSPASSEQSTSWINHLAMIVGEATGSTSVFSSTPTSPSALHEHTSPPPHAEVNSDDPFWDFDNALHEHANLPPDSQNNSENPFSDFDDAFSVYSLVASLVDSLHLSNDESTFPFPFASNSFIMDGVGSNGTATYTATAASTSATLEENDPVALGAEGQEASTLAPPFTATQTTEHPNPTRHSSCGIVTSLATIVESSPSSPSPSLSPTSAPEADTIPAVAAGGAGQSTNTAIVDAGSSEQNSNNRVKGSAGGGGRRIKSAAVKLWKKILKPNQWLRSKRSKRGGESHTG
ncbi:hypothetical protein DFH27DRAFT_616448 [Peziza echinospora]|nr:hypothetical protein DFH27DRAFT_616448 [Peziza echinospora]